MHFALTMAGSPASRWLARRTNARPSAARARSSRTRSWGTHTLSTQARPQPVRCSRPRPSRFDSVGMAEHCHRASFSIGPTQYAPLALGLIDLGSSHIEHWMRALVAGGAYGS